jgi:CheY-like chemotaxis protein
MPRMDGLEAATRIRASDPYTPILALSADVMPREKSRALEVGMNDFIEKPFHRRELYRKIRRFVG